ncbi:MAG TPA: carbohydrate kinase, partial [bacterium]|nr:carbohydrate kinase [bacterium]
MDRTRLHEILSQYPNHRILVFGDFFLDRYLVIDPALDEISLETGKTAYQVTAKRSQPGAAGTVVNNLRALEVGHITALTVIGDDGEGYELRQGLTRQGVNIDSILITPDRFTPTYTKPMRKTNGGEEEMNRQDIKNRVPLTEAMETELLKRLDALLPAVDAVIIADQVQERDCGVITGRVRGTLARLATEHPRILF